MQELDSLTVKDLEQRSLSRHEPRWLRLQRKNAWEQFQVTPPPDWKRKKLQPISLSSSFTNFWNKQEKNILKNENKQESKISGKIVLVDGQLSSLFLKPELAYEGVVLCDMKTAVLERADLLEPYFTKKNSIPEDIFSFLQDALWDNGYFLWIPKGLKVQEPFEIEIVQENPAFSLTMRNLVVAEQVSSVKIQEQCSSQDQRADVTLVLSKTQVCAEKSARIQTLDIQRSGSHVMDFSTRIYEAKAESDIHALHVGLGAGSGQDILSGTAREEGATIRHEGILVGSEHQQRKQVVSLHHEAPLTKGSMKYKGLLKDKAYAFLDGMIHVTDQGKKTVSRLEEQVMLLSSKARCDALPALDIHTSDVSIAHSAAVSHFDEEKLFYLMSRGLSEKDARALLVEGFFSDLLEPFKDSDSYCLLTSLIDHKLSLSP